jgi:hypothetical protein
MIKVESIVVAAVGFVVVVVEIKIVVAVAAVVD